MSYRAVSPSNVLNFLNLMNYHQPKTILGNVPYAKTKIPYHENLNCDGERTSPGPAGEGLSLSWRFYSYFLRSSTQVHNISKHQPRGQAA